MQVVSVLVLYCLVVFWTNCTSFFFFFFFFNELLFHPKQKIASSFFMVVSALQSLLFLNGTFMDELLVIGFKLGVPGRSRHDMVKKEKMDRIFKYKCCIAFLLGCKTSKYDGVLKNAQNQLEILGLCIQDLEGGQEYLFRRLIETRFSILQYPQPWVLQFMQAVLS